MDFRYQRNCLRKYRNTLKGFGLVSEISWQLTSSTTGAHLSIDFVGSRIQNQTDKRQMAEKKRAHLDQGKRCGLNLRPEETLVQLPEVTSSAFSLSFRTFQGLTSDIQDKCFSHLG